jgi:hypothetical protein
VVRGCSRNKIINVVIGDLLLIGCETYSEVYVAVYCFESKPDSPVTLVSFIDSDMRLTKPLKRGLCRSGEGDRLCLRRFWTLSNLLVPLPCDLAYVTWDEHCRSPMNSVRIGNELFPNLRLPFLDPSDIPGENSLVPAVPLAPKGGCSEDENWSLLDLSADEQY